MKHVKKSLMLLMLLTSIMGSQTFAQDFLNLGAILKVRSNEEKQERAKEVMQDNEYISTGYEKGIFLCNPLMLNEKPLDYGEFSIASSGELTVNKGGVAAEQTMQVPFYVYLRRDGKKILIPHREKPDPKQIKVDISEILKHAELGDNLVIEAVRNEDGPVKRILKLRGDGC